jgi:hypothetical protein
MEIENKDMAAMLDDITKKPMRNRLLTSHHATEE